MKKTTTRTATTRRKFIKGAAAGGAALASNKLWINIAGAQSSTVKIGYIDSFTGPRGTFSEPAQWSLDKAKALVKNGLKVGSKNYAVDFVVGDSQSVPDRAGQVVSDFILKEKVDLLLGNDGDSHYTGGELADQKGVPFITSLTQWEAFIYARHSTPEKGYPWCFFFCFGAGDLAKNYVGLWNTLKTNKKIGTFYFDHPAGQAFASKETGIPFYLNKYGYEIHDAGFFKPDTDDFSTQISLFKNNNCEIMSGFLFDVQFAPMWGQAGQAGYKPRVVTCAAPFLFPHSLEILGDHGDGMSTEAWWTPDMGFTSSLTGATGQQLADSWEKETGKQWTQPLGYMHAMYEVAFDALKASGDPKSNEAIRHAIQNMNLNTMVGPVNFKDSKIKSCAVTEVAMGQWRLQKPGSKWKYKLGIVYSDPTTGAHIKPNAQMVMLDQL
jgi:branched-chain amino acid transport system substrate-binding protein